MDPARENQGNYRDKSKAKQKETKKKEKEFWHLLMWLIIHRTTFDMLFHIYFRLGQQI